MTENTPKEIHMFGDVTEHEDGRMEIHMPVEPGVREVKQPERINVTSPDVSLQKLSELVTQLPDGFKRWNELRKLIDDVNVYQSEVVGARDAEDVISTLSTLQELTPGPIAIEQLLNKLSIADFQDFSYVLRLLRDTPQAVTAETFQPVTFKTLQEIPGFNERMFPLDNLLTVLDSGVIQVTITQEELQGLGNFSTKEEIAAKYNFEDNPTYIDMLTVVN